MPRIRRYIFNTLTVVSLLLLLATVGLWVDSYSKLTQVTYGGMNVSFGWRSCRNGVQCFLDNPSWRPDHHQVDVQQVSEDKSVFDITMALPDDIDFNEIADQVPDAESGWMRERVDWDHNELIMQDDFDWSEFGFGTGWGTDPFDTTIKRYSVLVPHWFLVLLFILLPINCFAKWWRRRHLPDNPCSKCGYDMMGNTTAKCPECGRGSQEQTLKDEV